jgi:hypothetical protein
MPTAKGWSRAFDDPIELPDGRTLRTLGDAGHYIAALPKATQQRPEWQTATKSLMRAAEGRGLLMFAYIERAVIAKRLGLLPALSLSRVPEGLSP